MAQAKRSIHLASATCVQAHLHANPAPTPPEQEFPPLTLHPPAACASLAAKLLRRPSQRPAHVAASAGRQQCRRCYELAHMHLWLYEPGPRCDPQ